MGLTHWHSNSIDYKLSTMYSKKYSKDQKINNPEKYSLTKNLIWSSPQNFNLTMDIYSPKNISALRNKKISEIIEKRG